MARTRRIVLAVAIMTILSVVGYGAFMWFHTHEPLSTLESQIPASSQQSSIIPLLRSREEVLHAREKLAEAVHMLFSGQLTVVAMKQALHWFNLYAPPLNADKFTLPANYTTLLWMVGHKFDYFTHALAMLKKNTGLDRVLLVIASVRVVIILSHYELKWLYQDRIDDRYSKLAEEIDFCQVKQIYDIGSRHFNPDFSRGSNARDHKRRFWYFLNVLFDQLMPPTGDVILLEEDNYVSFDFLSTLRGLIALKNKCCNGHDYRLAGSLAHGMGCWISVADPTHEPLREGRSYNLSAWNRVYRGVPLGNAGVGLDRRQWGYLSSRNGTYWCSFREVNWDWNSQHMRAIGALTEETIRVSIPRGYHCGVCGMSAHFDASFASSCEAAPKEQRERVERIDAMIRETPTLEFNWSDIPCEDIQWEGVHVYNTSPRALQSESSIEKLRNFPTFGRQQWPIEYEQECLDVYSLLHTTPAESEKQQEVERLRDVLVKIGIS